VPYELDTTNYIKLSKGEELVILQSVDGASTYKGNKYTGKDNSDIFSFRTTDECNNGTGVDDGQIPDLFYILLE